MLRVVEICCWILLCLGNRIPNIVANRDVQCEIVQKDQGDLKVFGKKTDVPPNEDKCWRIELKNSSDEVVIVFHNFNLLESDSLIVRRAADEGSTSADLFGPFRGQRGIFSVFTGLSSVVIRLRTSSQKPWDRHFMAKYYTNECKYEETVYNQGTFSSPLYLKDRVVPLECTYSFIFIGSTSKLQKLVMSFLEMNLTRGSNVQVDGSETMDGKYEGANMPNKLLSSSRLQVKLLIDPATSQFQRFEAHYELATASCSSVIILNGSALSTFGVPPSLIPSEKNGVSASAQCHWILRSPNDTRIGANLLTNSARMGSRDRLTIGGPSPFESVHLGAGVTGKFGSLHSPSNELWLTFTSPSIQPDLALRMQATFHATGDYMWNSGNFSVKPDSNSIGVFLLEVPSDRRVRLLLPKSRSSILELHSDFDRSSLPFLRLLPTIPLESVISPSNQMMLVTKSRFEASFDGVDRACHEVAQPFGNGFYTAPRSCSNYTWLLPPRSDPEEFSELRFLTLNLLRPGDLVTLHHLDEALTLVATLGLDSINLPPLHIPPETGMLMKLNTHDQSGDATALPFICIFKKSCKGRYELKSGQSVDFKSPSFPDRYPLGSTCQWELRWRGPILIDAHSVQLAHPAHRLTVGDVSILNSIKSRRTVIKGPTKVLFSAKSNGFGEEHSGSGFWITATALDCGGIVKEPSDKLIVPAGSITCVWAVNVSPLGKLQTPQGVAMVVYNRSALSEAELLIQVPYRTEEYTVSSICGGNKCTSAAWRCIGINDCGDYKDEMNCSVTSRPTWSTASSSSPSTVVVTEAKGKSTGTSTTLNDSFTRSGQLTKSNEAGVSMMHLSLYLLAAAIVGATIPSSVYWCLLKRANGKRKTDSQWAMIGNGKNTENADGISL